MFAVSLSLLCKSKYPKRLEFLCISFVVINCGEKGVERPSFFMSGKWWYKYLLRNYKNYEDSGFGILLQMAKKMCRICAA